MIQHHRFGTGLNKYLPYIPYKDNSITSDNYFGILNPPDRLYVGKTSFRIRANFETLVPGSTIYIDIIDSSGNTIYHEVADFIGKDRSRLIVAHIYENTPPGEATIYIAGRTKKHIESGALLEYNNNPDSWEYLHYPNIVWTKKVVIVPTDQNNEEVLFLSSPIVSCHERNEYFSTAPVSARKKTIQAAVTESVSLQSTIQPFQYSNTSRYATTHNETGKYIDLDPSGSQDFIQSRQIQVPEYFGFNTIRSENLEFNKDMVGGKINIKNPGDLDTEYSASIVKIIDKHTIQVDAPFNFNNGSRNVSSFTSAGDFTASYISRDVNITTFETESFVQIDFKNLEPIAGSVEKIRVSYKPYGTFGEFISVGEFPINEQNYLIDSSSLLADKISIIEQPIGDLSGSYAYDQYWDLISNPDLDLYTEIQEAFTFDRGGSLFFTASSAVTASQVDYLSYLKLTNDYGIVAGQNTEFKLELSTRYTGQTTYTNVLSDYENQQIDIFISGSNVITDEVHNTKLHKLLSTKKFGTYIGSISTLKGTTQLDSKLYFKTIDAGTIYPIFVIRSGNGWEFKEITLSPRKELGYSPNQAKLMVPINTLKTDIELVLKLEYLSGNGKKSDIDTTLYGLSFTGAGFPKDRLLSGSRIVSSSGQFKNLLDLYTGSLTSSGGNQNYDVHVQSTPAATWSFNHNLRNQRPVITVYDISSSVIIPERIIGASDILTYIYFPVSQSGYASATIGSILPTGSIDYTDIINKPTLISSSQQIATDISGSFNSLSASISSDKLNRIGSGVISSSIQIASDISGSSTSLSASISSNKLNRVGDNAYTSSGQVSVTQAISGSYVQITELYTVGTSSLQVANFGFSVPLYWAATASILNLPDGLPKGDLFISGAFMKLLYPGTYQVEAKIHIHSSSNSVSFWLMSDPNGVGEPYVTTSAFYSASTAYNGDVYLNYYYTTTGSNDRLGIYWYAPHGHSIPPQAHDAHSYFKITRLYTS